MDYAHCDMHTRMVLAKARMSEMDSTMRHLLHLWLSSKQTRKNTRVGFDKMFAEMILDERGCCDQCHAAAQQR